MKQLIKQCVMVVFLVLSSACATTQQEMRDPFEKMNRAIYHFNTELDRYALKPIAKGYQFVVPSLVREGVTNVFSSVNDLYNALNHLLQLNIASGASDMMRFVINTVFGVGGLFDVATLANLPKDNTDFGITLARYGMPTGPYLVLPIFGPSTLRDASGFGFSYFLNVVSYIKPSELSWSIYGVQLVNVRANLLGGQQVINEAAIDEYSFVRNAYLQRRNSLVSMATSSGDESEYDDLPDYSKAIEAAQPDLTPSQPAHK